MTDLRHLPRCYCCDELGKSVIHTSRGEAFYLCPRHTTEFGTSPLYKMSCRGLVLVWDALVAFKESLTSGSASDTSSSQ